MALFNKLFSSHKRKTTTATAKQQSASQFPFCNDQVRILLYQETDNSGRKLLFDSTAIQKISSATEAGTTTTSGSDRSETLINGCGYKYTKPDSDYNSIGEMVFGSVAMSFRGTALKVHWLQEPTRLICSQVFLSPIQSNKLSTNTLDTSYPNDFNTIDTSSLNSFSLSVCISDNLNRNGDKFHTNPIDVSPSDISEGGHASFAYSDSGYSGTDPWNVSCSSYCPYSSTRSSFGSVYSDHENGRKFSIDSNITDSTAPNNVRSNGNIQRRILRNISTSFENRKSISDSFGYIGDNSSQQTQNGGGGGGGGGSEGCVVNNVRRCSEQVESRSNPEMFRRRGVSGDVLRLSGNMPTRRRSKLGLAVCIKMSESVEDEMQLFCSEHIALFESMLCRLKVTAEKAWINQKKSQVILLHEWFATSAWLTDLFTAPRLDEPVWLALSSDSSKNPIQLAQSFMNELCWLLTSADTKDTNFFVSTLLTAILTHHLGWVCTVAPMSINLNGSQSTNAAEIAKEEKAKISEISKFHPYNVLWAQMSDLHGAIGNPPKISKTIVCGTESTTINKVLNILTYFIRCSEIRRDGRTEVLEKDDVEVILDNFKCEQQKTIFNNCDKSENGIKGTNLKKSSAGLSRTSTCIKNLTDLTAYDDEFDDNDCQLRPSEAINPSVFNDHLKKNDLPNVYVFRDSRFVRQELRNGNFQMDTGIEMNTKQKLDLKTYKIKSDKENIKLLVTSPDNEEVTIVGVCPSDISSDIEEAHECLVSNSSSESLTFNSVDTGPNLSELITANSLGDLNSKSKSSKFLWGIEPIKEGLSVEQWQNIERGRQIASFQNEGNCFSDGKLDLYSVYSSQEQYAKTELKRSKSLYSKSTNARTSGSKILKKSKLLRKISLEQQKQCNHDDNEECCPSSLKSHPSLSDLITANSVGVSERLTWGIEPVKETICLEEEQHFEIAKKRIESTHRQTGPGVFFVLGDNEALVLNKNQSPKLKISDDPLVAEKSVAPVTAATTKSSKKQCSHKKHSGVKFNFEKYPQIATNYMKNKNLDIAEYDFVKKGITLDNNNTNSSFIYGQSSSSNFPIEPSDDEESDECECCGAGNVSRVLQTPSNATELEFSSDDNSYTSFMDASKVVESKGLKKNDKMITQPSSTLSSSAVAHKPLRIPAATKEPVNKMIQLVSLPMPKYNVQEKKKQMNDGKSEKHRPGFIPSLFVGSTDHFIADMVLQGIISTSNSWEGSLKQNLAISSRCATIEQTPTENIAIVANTSKWDVKIVSSQTYVLPSGSATSGPIGMSQLVSSMLETVHAMWSAGVPAYQCMSFLESKLQEMYLQSETLAAFLLASDFCSLNTLTSALNLSANDVPLLLSVASIHTPQLTKKYDVSFR